MDTSINPFLYSFGHNQNGSRPINFNPEPEEGKAQGIGKIGGNSSAAKVNATNNQNAQNSLNSRLMAIDAKDINQKHTEKDAVRGQNLELMG